MAGESDGAHSCDNAGGEDQREAKRAGSDGEVPADPGKSKKLSRVEPPPVEPVLRSVRRKEENSQANSPCKDLGNEYRKAGASKSHGRKTETSVDQQVIENDVEPIDEEGDQHGCPSILNASEETHGGEKEKRERGSDDPDAKVSGSLNQHRRLGAHQEVQMRCEKNPENRDGESSQNREKNCVQTYLAADLRLVGTAMVAYKRGGAENEKGEEPVDPSDERGSDRARSERLYAKAADHRRVR